MVHNSFNQSILSNKLTNYSLKQRIFSEKIIFTKPICLVLFFILIFFSKNYGQEFKLIKEFLPSETRELCIDEITGNFLFVHKIIIGKEWADYIEFLDGEKCFFEQDEFFLAFHAGRIFAQKECELRIYDLINEQLVLFSLINLEKKDICSGSIYPIGVSSVMITNSWEVSGNYAEIIDFINNKRKILIENNWYREIILSSSNGFSTILFDMQNSLEGFFMFELKGVEILKHSIGFDQQVLTIDKFNKNTIFSYPYPPSTTCSDLVRDSFSWNIPAYMPQGYSSFNDSLLVFYDPITLRIYQIEINKGEIISTFDIGLEKRKCLEILYTNDEYYCHLFNTITKENFISKINFTNKKFSYGNKIPLTRKVRCWLLDENIYFGNNEKILKYERTD